MRLDRVIVAMAAAALLCAGIVEAIVAGVDFGGEFFKIALVKPGTPFEIVTNVHSKRKTETMVAFDGAERLYGADAATVGVRRPQTAYSQIRRFLGTTVDSPEVVSLLKEEYFPYELVANDTRGGTVALKHDKKTVFHAEELAAMVFSHARQITNAFAEAPVKDWVVTVPSFFTQSQRQALLDAAELADVRVLSLINENTAAALQLAVHSTFTEPKRILFYNMGSTSLQVSIAEFSNQIVPDGFKKNKTISSFQVLASAWDEALGGAKFDLRLAEHLATEFNAKLDGEDVRTLARPMAKIRAQAKKTKTVLSANDQIPVVMQSLYKDLDFFTSMTRSQLEKLCADLFERALGPVQQALAKAGLTVDQIDEIELIGGAVRMPKIQQELKSFFAGKDLGVHLNGDEAMALGAAFHAANLSNSFRVRQVGMTDLVTYPVGVRLVDLENTESEAEGDAKHWVKRTSLFTEATRLGLRKAVSFSHSKDISCTFRYDKPSALPAGTSIHLGKYSLTGVEKFAKDMADKNLGEPKVTISFEVDSNGIVQIAKAEATLEEEYEVEVEVKKKDDKKKKKDKKKDEDKEEEKDEEKEEEPKEMVKEMRKKTHRAVLEVTRVHGDASEGAEFSVLPMSVQAKKDSIRMLREMEQADNKRKADLEAKNRLETFVYTARDTLSAKEESITQVTTSEHIEKLQADLEETEDWLYEDGDKVDASEYNKKIKNLDSQLSAILFRVSELKDFPIAINAASEYAFSTRALMEEWVESKPQVTEEERGDVLAKVEELEAWLADAEKKQKAASATEDPVVKSTDVTKQLQGVKKLVSTLSKKPELPKPKSEDNETTADGGDAKDSESADSAEKTDSSSGSSAEATDDDKEPHEEL